jgi:hypothetical protein
MPENSLPKCNANEHFYKAINSLNPHSNPFSFFNLSLLMQEGDKELFQNLKVKNGKLFFFSFTHVQKEFFLNIDTNGFSTCGNGHMLQDFVFCDNNEDNCIDALKAFMTNTALYISQALGVEIMSITVVAREGGDNRALNDYSFHRDSHHLDFVYKDICLSNIGRSDYEYNFGFNIIGENSTFFYKPSNINSSLTLVPVPDEQEVNVNELFTAGVDQAAVWLRGENGGIGAIHAAPYVDHQRLAIIFTTYQKDNELLREYNSFTDVFNHPAKCSLSGLSSELELEKCFDPNFGCEYQFMS